MIKILNLKVLKKKCDATSNEYVKKSKELERWWQDMTGKKIMEKEFKLKKRKITFEMIKTTLKEKLEFLLAIVIIAVIVYWLKK